MAVITLILVSQSSNRAVPAHAGPLAVVNASLAIDDVSEGNPAGSLVVVDVLANDDPSLVVSSVMLVRPNDGLRAADFNVEGEGWWRAVANEVGGRAWIEFDPEPGFVGNPTPQQYSVLDAEGGEHFATMTITYQSASTTTTTVSDPKAAELPSTGRAADLLFSAAFLLLLVGSLLLRVSAHGSSGLDPNRSGRANQW